jgi:hypothetical protein
MAGAGAGAGRAARAARGRETRDAPRHCLGAALGGTRVRFDVCVSVRAEWPATAPDRVDNQNLSQFMPGQLFEHLGDSAQKLFSRLLQRDGIPLSGCSPSSTSGEILLDVESVLGPGGAMHAFADKVKALQDLFPRLRRPCELSGLTLREVLRRLSGE